MHIARLIQALVKVRASTDTNRVFNFDFKLLNGMYDYARMGITKIIWI